MLSTLQAPSARDGHVDVPRRNAAVSSIGASSPTRKALVTSVASDAWSGTIGATAAALLTRVALANCRPSSPASQVSRRAATDVASAKSQHHCSHSPGGAPA